MRPRKYRMVKSEALTWAEGFGCAKNYLNRLNSGKALAAHNLWHFCEWAKTDPAKLLALKKSYESLDAEKLLDRFVYSEVNLPASTKWHVVQAVRGFFRVNYRELRREAGHLEYTILKPQRFPSKAQRYDLYRACYNPRDRFLVMVSLCSALALETLSRLRWFHFEQDWMRRHTPHISVPGALLKGHDKGKYRGVRQETFLTPEAKRAGVEYREWFTRVFRHVWSDGDHVFLCVRANLAQPLTRFAIARTMLEVSGRSGVQFGVHDGRRVLQTALESVGTSPQWIRKIKGRKVSGEENPYSKPAIEQLREKYVEALGELEFLGQPTGEAEALSAEDREDLMALVRYMRLHPEKFRPL